MSIHFFFNFLLNEILFYTLFKILVSIIFLILSNYAKKMFAINFQLLLLAKISD